MTQENPAPRYAIAITIGMILTRVEGPFASVSAAEAHNTRAPRHNPNLEPRILELTPVEWPMRQNGDCPAVAVSRRGGDIIAIEGPFSSIFDANTYIARGQHEPGANMEAWPLTSEAVSLMGRAA